MAYFQLLIVMAALYLFGLLLVQPFLLAWRLFSRGLSESSRRRTHRVGPDDVDPMPILDTKDMPSYYRQLGLDRHGRLIFECGSGRYVKYYYLDRKVSESQPTANPQGQRHSNDNRFKGLLLGWKGFDANSSHWEVLGVAADASVGQIKVAYRKLIAKFHPDRFQNLSGQEIAEIERDAKRINAAYAELVKS